jgi:RNA polymerase sigma-70 factor (ECF subfamily)
MPALLAKLRQRDPAALKAIVDANARRLYRAARGMGFGPGEAEDLVQEVFVTFLRTLDRFEGRAKISTWLFGILHHKVQERRRADARDDHDPLDALFESRFDARGSWVRPPVDPEREMASREAGAAIQQCLEELSPLQREAFQLREVEDLPALDVSNILGKTVTHIAVLLHRARTRLRECLHRKGWGSEP